MIGGKRLVKVFTNKRGIKEDALRENFNSRTN